MFELTDFIKFLTKFKKDCHFKSLCELQGVAHEKAKRRQKQKLLKIKQITSQMNVPREIECVRLG